MFGWFKPQCPVDSAAKQWIEERLRWLSDQFGRDLFTAGEIILPTDEFFPDPVDQTEASIRDLLDRVCGYMKVNPALIKLQLFTNRTELWLVNEQGKYLPTGAAGWFSQQNGQTVIQIETSQLDDLEGLIGTIAHELAHVRLIGENWVIGNEYDNELLTDLTVIFHGMGIFLGNSPRNWDSLYSDWPGTNLRRPEYMTLPMFAYALAHAAWWRGETKPNWHRHLSYDLRACFHQAIRYLNEIGDSTFAPER